MTMAEVILVDESNRELGTMEKLETHHRGLLHRAFSIFVFNSNGELLIQKRDTSKYHSGGLWSNTVCSHPMPGQDDGEATHLRLREEMGFDCPLQQVGCVIYRAELENGLIEHEYDCIFRGLYDGRVEPDAGEVEDYRWMSLAKLKSDLRDNPEKYTFWFRKILLESGAALI